MSEQAITDSQWPVGHQVTFGQLHGHPLHWVVIRSRDNCRLLISLHPIAQRRMGATKTTNSWEKSELREWLNIYALHEAFTDEERRQLCRIGGDYISLPSHDEMIFWAPLPVCVYNYSFKWWLRSLAGGGEDDYSQHFGSVSGNGKQLCLSSLRADNTAAVRPIIAVSLDASRTAIPSTFFDYYECPFCGTNNTDNTVPCTCCGFSPRRRYNMMCGQYSGAGFVTAIFTVPLLLLGIFPFNGTVLGLLTIIAALIILVCGLKSCFENRHEIQNARKYENQTDHALFLRTCKHDHERTAAIYHNAGILQKNATNAEDYHYAANMYALIPDYQDAVAQREACLKATENAKP